MYDAATLDSLSRKELQALAKEYKVCRANAKSADIIQALADFANSQDEEHMMSEPEVPAVVEAAEAVPQQDQAASEETADLDAIANVAVEPRLMDEQQDDESEGEEEEDEKETELVEEQVEESAVEADCDLTAAMSNITVACDAPAPPVTSTSSNMERLTAFINDRDDLQFESNGTNVLCTVTNHSMPLDMEIICGHLDGQKYKAVTSRLNADFSRFGDAICDHPTLTGKLYCPLTERSLNRVELEVQQYLCGAKYNKAYLQKFGQENPLKIGAPIKLKGVASPKGKKTYFVDSPCSSPALSVLGESNAMC